MRLFSNKFVAAGFQQIVCAIGKLLFVCFVGLFLAVESIECIHFEKKRRGENTFIYLSKNNGRDANPKIQALCHQLKGSPEQ